MSVRRLRWKLRCILRPWISIGPWLLLILFLQALRGFSFITLGSFLLSWLSISHIFAACISGRDIPTVQ